MSRARRLSLGPVDFAFRTRPSLNVGPRVIPAGSAVKPVFIGFSVHTICNTQLSDATLKKNVSLHAPSTILWAVWINSEKVAIAPIAAIVELGPRDCGKSSFINPDIRDLIGAYLFDRLSIWPNTRVEHPRRTPASNTRAGRASALIEVSSRFLKRRILIVNEQ